jgi:broad specificity phosphatase PhoE
MLTIELVAHMDAGDRRLWTAEQDKRPLSELGREQAQCLCQNLARKRVDALFSSPALRCRQTIEPLADRFALPIEVITGLHETSGFAPGHGWGKRHVPAEAYGATYAAGLVFAEVRRIRSRFQVGRVVACSHGDVVPAFASFISAAYGLSLPEPLFRPIWYTLQFDSDECRGWLHHVPADFPQPAP